MAVGLNDDELAQVTYISGIDQNGAVASDTFGMYATQQYGFDPPRAYISKWYNDANGSPIAATSTAGTSGGTVTYAFGDGVGINAQAAYKATLTLWSDIADIQFTQITDTSKAGLLITNTDHGLSDTFVPSNGYRLAGAKDLPTQMAPNARGGQAVINIYSTDDNAFSGVTPDTNWVTSTLVHEEGHMLGLGHSGPYNGGAAPGDQFGVYDNAAYSVMSYFNPIDTSTKYYNQYPVYFGSSYASAQTPMMFDILAAQRLYGASTRATFSGGQTYGFNSNIADATKAFYDFNTNSEPFVTIYNSGTNNTLDLSGFVQGSYVNLNPGTFSSASANGDLINNIAISYNTRIDKAIGGAGDDYFTLNGNGDQIDGGGGNNTVIIQGSKADYLVTSTGTGTSTVLNKTTGTVDTLVNIQDIQFQAPVCFTTGTAIRLVRDGAWIDASVESLRVGDVAVTVADRFRPIRWIGHRTVVPAEHPVPSDQWPVRIRAGAFGAGLPARDLRLSPGHPVQVGAEADGAGGVLVPVMFLINGTTIAREHCESVTYWHVELDAHDILLAEGLAAESYIDFGNRPWFSGADGALLDPDFVAPGMTGRCRPVALDGPLVEAERQRLDAVFASDLLAHCAWPQVNVFA